MNEDERAAKASVTRTKRMENPDSLRAKQHTPNMRLCIVSCVARMIGALTYITLQYVKHYLPLKSIQKMYKSLIEPYFRFHCAVWGYVGTAILQSY